ncbi:TlyA family rRNA (cytidine-2'-O)-methyltransferase [Archaeoglobales archaeon]|nr:MAG: TlyA family rRNA (cytidine-2'-O)-methyltransferase [Archaeoglobales archaeon]
MRLDKLLVTKGYFTTRQKAKEAIKRGFVIVNGVRITKPSKEVDIDAKIVVVEREKPKGYWKLRELDEKWNFVKGVVLDLGSSAGGFLIYASEKAEFVYGIEYSKEFEEELRSIERKAKNVRVFIEDAFKFDLSKIGNVDVILNDLTLDTESSLKALERFLSNLKDDGFVLFIQKIGKRFEKVDFSRIGLKIIKRERSDSKKEIYYLLEKL